MQTKLKGFDAQNEFKVEKTVSPATLTYSATSPQSILIACPKLLVKATPEPLQLTFDGGKWEKHYMGLNYSYPEVMRLFFPPSFSLSLLVCTSLKRLRNNTTAQHSITPVFSVSCVKKKKYHTETKNMIFYLGVVVVDKSTTNANIFNYSTCYVSPVVTGNETADRNEVWTGRSILMYVAAHSSRRVALSATRGFTMCSCCAAFLTTNLIGRLKLPTRSFILPNFPPCLVQRLLMDCVPDGMDNKSGWRPYALRSYTFCSSVYVALDGSSSFGNAVQLCSHRNNALS